MPLPSQPTVLTRANDTWDGTGTLQDQWVSGGAGDDTITGGDGNDRLVGGSGNDSIFGGLGNDTLAGGLGDDLLVGGDGDDKLFGHDGADTLQGGSGRDRLVGGDGDDQLEGGDGNDWLIGGAGRDRLNGGAGTDTADFEGAAASYRIENVGDGSVRVVDRATGEVDVLTDIERVKFVDTASVMITQLVAGQPTDGDNAVTGTTGNDEIYALAGNDTVDTGGGDDFVDAGLGDDLVQGGAGNDRLIGGGGRDVLQGGDGDDSIFADYSDGRVDGGSGHDTLHLAGNRSSYAFTTDPNGDIRVGFVAIQIPGVPNGAPTGNDRLLITGIEQVTFADGTFALSDLVTPLNSTSPTNGNDTITGTAGNDIIDALAGDDVVNGGEGDDELRGGNGNDTLTGGAGRDILIGGEGNDRLIGEATLSGDLAFDGGNGHDTVQLVSAGIIGGSSTPRITSVESFIGSNFNDIIDLSTFTPDASAFGPGVLGVTIDGGHSNDQLIGTRNADMIVGGSGDDTLVGGAGNDTLNGGFGRDNMAGGDGDDLLIAETGQSVDLVLDGGAGFDTLQFIDPVWVGGPSGPRIQGIEAFVGSNSRDIFDLGTYASGTGGNGVIVHAGSETDYVFGTQYADTLNGGAGDDYLVGGAGDDVLIGGAGQDLVNGGAGRDTFDLRETPAGLANQLWIQDFTKGTDIVDVRGLGFDFSQLTAVNGQVNGKSYAMVSFGPAGQEKQVVFQGLTTADITADMFLM
jgi:Ca2+-binding RTX toxin-like protein